MYVSRLELIDFRNYHDAVVDLDAGTTLFVGANGQGKTNLVEALVVVALQRSHRAPSDASLVRAGEERAIIRTTLAAGDRRVQVDVQLATKGANRAQVNQRAIRMGELPGYCAVVLFSPEDLALVRGEPAHRRRFLDELVVQRTPRLSGTMSDYDRVVKQRNALLKSARASRLRADDLTTLDVWDARLVDLGLELSRARRALIAELNPHVGAAYRAIAGDDHPATIALDTAVPDDADEFRALVRSLRGDELERAQTMSGPHRDDLAMVLNGLPARHTASHGESWSFALALRLASVELVRTGPLGDPIVILDDVFAELDANRRARLAHAIAPFEQVLITAAVAGDVPDALAQRRVWIRAGRIVADPEIAYPDIGNGADDRATDGADDG